VLEISAIRRQGLNAVWKAIVQAHASANVKMSTPVLTRLVHEAAEHQAPAREGRFKPKMRYAHQGGMNPPLVVIHGTSLDRISASYKRFLEGRLRAHFKLVGTPVRIEMRSADNPFDSKGT
jgi:GTPase